MIPDKTKFRIPGVAEKTSDYCNKVTATEYCEDCKTFEPRFYHCNSWDCPTCYFYTASRAARRMEERLQGVQKAYSFIGKYPGKIQHVVLSVPPEEYKEFDYKKARKKAILYCKQIGISGGSIVFHPFRVKREFRAPLLRSLKEDNTPGGIWRAIHEDRLKLGSWLEYVFFAPHFHVLGYYPKIIVQSKAFEKATGWTYKAIGVNKPRNVYYTARYLLTHHAVLEGHNVVYFGIASYSKTAVEIQKTTELKKCPKCSSENYYKFDCGEERFKRFLEGSEQPQEDELFIHVRICKKVKRYYVRITQASITESFDNISTVG